MQDFTPNLFVRSGNELRRLDLSDINYARSEGNYCELNTSRQAFTLKTSLVRLRQKLPSEQFVQVHRSYLVRLGAIRWIDLGANQIWVGSSCLPIGRAFRDELLQKLPQIP